MQPTSVSIQRPVTPGRGIAILAAGFLLVFERDALVDKIRQPGVIDLGSVETDPRSIGQP